MTLRRTGIGLLLLLTLGATAPTTQRSSSSGRGNSYSDRYGLLEERNIFVRERASRRDGGRGTASTTQAAPRPPEERFVLTGIVLEEEGFRAYVENDRFETLRLAPGDKVARGRVAAIVIDAIAYELTGSSSNPTTAPATGAATSGPRGWVEIGSDLTGKPSSMLAPSSSSSSYSSGATTAPTTGPVIASDIANLNPNDPNLSAEQRMKLRRAMELQKK